MKQHLTLSLALLFVGLLTACSMPATKTSTESEKGSLSDPKSSLAHQFELVKAGDLEKLKACLTPRVRDGLTQEIVDKAKTDAAKYTIEDLYDSAEMGEADGKKTAKIKMKNGRTLTTLVETDGQWLADTIWFK
jgi:predicted lipid-binding transport protein (Tim44 family)